MGYVIVAVIAVAVAIFTLQNTERVVITVLVWQLQNVPLAGLVLASFGAGIGAAGIPLLLQRWQLRRRLERLERERLAPPGPPEDTR
jgi:uncharacterized integral membrane protein